MTLYNQCCLLPWLVALAVTVGSNTQYVSGQVSVGDTAPQERVQPPRSGGIALKSLGAEALMTEEQVSGDYEFACDVGYHGRRGVALQRR